VYIARSLKCKKCKTKRYRQQAYQHWHNVECYEGINFPNDLFYIGWILNWWVCDKCYKSEDRYHDIDGFQYFVSWKFPFIRRG
jgi:hypothetical protein